MQQYELEELVNQIISQKREDKNTEIKAAEYGCPKRLYDTLSSFSNQDDGGKLIFGIDEDNDFKLVGVYNAQDLQKQINNQCKEMEPIVRPLISVAEVQNKTIVCAEIPGIEITQRPCYYKGKGKITGSYVRIGDSDEPMTDYEIYSYEAYRKKYQDDIRTVENASFKVINQAALDEYKIMCKKDKPHISQIQEEQFNELMSITKDGRLTLSTVLLFGIYPQAYFPQLAIIATRVFGKEIGDCTENGERFVDNRRIEGTIPDMLDGALNFVRNNMKTSTIIDPHSGRRVDKSEYPITAVREVILNALVHRDYSIHTEGMPIQLIMYNDRIEVKNPGGLYGRLRIDQLGKTQPDTRNPVLAVAMETLRLTENRYSGIPTIRSEMSRAGLPEPKFEDTRGTFVVTLYNSSPESDKNNDLEKAILDFCATPRTRQEISDFLQLSSTSYAISHYVKPLINSKKMDIENKKKPNSPTQRYFTVRK